MQRYFLDEPYRPQERFVIEGEAYHHMVRVMRMAVKDQVYLAFNDQIAIIAEISEMKENEVFLVEVAKESVQKELPCKITIASGYPKGDKLDWIVQKGTELGAHGFVGFPAAASVVKWDAKKTQKATRAVGQDCTGSGGTVASPSRTASIFNGDRKAIL